MTTSITKTLRSSLNNANANELSATLQRLKVGDALSPVKVTFAALSAAAAIDITTAASKAAATITGLATLLSGENLPAINLVRTLRVTASGTAGSLGTYIVSDAGGTAIVPPGGAGAAVGVALLSDDGKTITFPNTVTAFVLEYMPRPAVSLDTEYAAST